MDTKLNLNSFNFSKFKTEYILFLIALLLIIYYVRNLFLSIIKTIMPKSFKVNETINKNSCNPLFMPFAGLTGNKSTLQNFKMCVEHYFKGFFNTYINEFKNKQNIMTNIIGGLTKDITQIQNIINYLQKQMHDITTDIYKRMLNDFKRLNRLFNELKSIFYSFGMMFKELFYALFSIKATFDSMINGPIGKVSRFFCFDGETPIDINDDIIIKIKDLKVGDKIRGGIVKTVLKFDTTGVEMYYYKNIIVSGYHLVCENNKWIRVKDSKYSKLFRGYSQPYIYCLNTTSNKIYSNGACFADYNEINNVNMIKSRILLMLKNINKNNIKNEICVDDFGFDENTKIKMKNNLKKIKNIKIGDITSTDSYVIGIVKTIRPDKICNISGILCSGSNIILNEDKSFYKTEPKWEQAYLHNDDKYMDINENNIFYNIITTDNIIKTNNGKTFKDYEITHDDTINSIIDRMSDIWYKV